MKFENKVVIVTGASSGIGEGVAKMFLEEGARLVGCGIEPAMKIESEKAIYVQADLTDPAQAQNVVDKAVEAFGQVDKLVCCAGVTFIGSLENTEYNTFMREISINLGGVFNMCKAAVKELVKSEDPSIVTIGSDLGVRPIPERIGYCPSKAGVIMLTKCIALESRGYDGSLTTLAAAYTGGGRLYAWGTAVAALQVATLLLERNFTALAISATLPILCRGYREA